MALLTACGPAAHRQPRMEGTPVLRAVYRDGAHHLLVALPDGAHALPTGDCTAPLLIDDASGAVRAISRDEAGRLVAQMQLSGAVRGTCPQLRR